MPQGEKRDLLKVNRHNRLTRGPDLPPEMFMNTPNVQMMGIPPAIWQFVPTAITGVLYVLRYTCVYTRGDLLVSLFGTCFMYVI